MITAGQPIVASDFVGTPSGAADSGKVAKLNADGKLELGFNPPRVLSMQHVSGTNSIPCIFSDVGDLFNVISSVDMYLETTTLPLQSRSITADWASANAIYSAVIIGLYLYVLVQDGSNNYRVYRYAKANLAAGGTLMTISGQAFGTTGGTGLLMFTDGTTFYFSCKAGNSASKHIISKYTLSGTTLTYTTDVTCGSISGNLDIPLADASGNIYGFNATDFIIRKYNSSGVLQLTTAVYTALGGYHYNIAGKFPYFRANTTFNYIKLVLF